VKVAPERIASSHPEGFSSANKSDLREEMHRSTFDYATYKLIWSVDKVSVDAIWTVGTLTRKNAWCNVVGDILRPR